MPSHWIMFEFCHHLSLACRGSPAKGRNYRGRFLLELTNEPISSTLPIARSWLQTPELNLSSGAFTSDGYRRDDRAFHLRAAGKS